MLKILAIIGSPRKKEFKTSEIMEYIFDMMKKKVDGLQKHMPVAYNHWIESGMTDCKSFAELYKSKRL